VFQTNDMVFTRGIQNLDYNWLHCIILGPMKNDLYPVHTILRDGTTCILHLKPDNLLLSIDAEKERMR
jgi:hypothetical protein